MGCTYGKTGVGFSRGIQLAFEARKMLDPSKVKVLNNEQVNPEQNERISDSSKIVDLSKQLHRQLLKIKGDFLQDDGTVKYPLMRESTDFVEFKNECAKLQLVEELSSLVETEKKAFFINIYNTLTIHSLVVSVVNEKTVLQIEKFWQMYAYKIGNFVFSLDDIEHGILRCNQLHPTHKEYFFKEGDPRRNFVMSELDPRIHFALNCGASSCPPIRLFSPDNLERGLDLASQNFCQQDVQVDVKRKEVRLSKILMWYGADFGPDENTIAEKIINYCTPEQQEDFGKIKENFKFVFSDYDWSIH